MTTAQKPDPQTSPGPTPSGPGWPAAYQRAAAAPLGLAGLVGAIALALYSVFSWQQWQSFTIRSWDLGIFTQLAKAYAHFQPPIVSLKGDGYNLLGDHFHPLLIVLGPIYKMFPHAFTLLVVQNVLFAVSVAVITHFAIKRLGRFTGVCIGIGYALSWGLQSAVDSQFHEIAFAVPLLALSLTALLDGRWRAAWIWAALLVFVKEDLGLTVLMIGLVMAFRLRTTAGLWLAAWGAGWFILTTKVILPALNPGSEWAYESQLNIGGLLSNPLAFFHPDKVVTVLLLVAITAGLCLFSPLVLIVLPTLAWRFLSELPVYWGQDWQYSAVLMPVVFVAGIDALCRHRALDSARLRQLLGAGILLISVVLSSQYAVGSLLDPARHFPLTTVTSSENALAAVPDGVTVETDISLMSYLVDRTEVYWIGNDNPPPQYVLIDVSARPDLAPTAAAAEAEQRFPGTRYETVFADSRYQVARQK